MIYCIGTGERVAARRRNEATLTKPKSTAAGTGKNERGRKWSENEIESE